VANFATNVELGAVTLTSGSLTGTGQVTVDGAFAWSGGSMSGAGATLVNGTLTLSNTSPFGGPSLDGRSLLNAGTIVYAGPGGLGVTGGAVIDNLPGASFVVQTNGGLSGSGTFLNEGDFDKSSGTGSTPVGLVFVNRGTVEVELGTLDLQAGGESTGAIAVSPGATLLLSGSTFTLRDTSVVGGAGTVQFGNPSSFSGMSANVSGAYSVTNTVVANATVDFQSDEELDTLTLSGGVLTGLHNLGIDGALNWTGGAQSGAGRTFIAGSLNISGSAGKLLDTRTLINLGTVTWTGAGGLNLNNGALLDNTPAGTFLVQNDIALAVPIFGTGRFVNEGLLRKQASSGTSTIQVYFSNTGTLDVQTGTLTITGPFANFDPVSRALVGGAYLVRGTLQFGTSTPTTNAATIVLDGASAGVGGLSALAANTSDGTLVIQNGATFSHAGPFSNAGGLIVGEGSAFVLTSGGAYTQTDGYTLLAGGTLTAPGGVMLQGGGLFGTGTINGNVTNAAYLGVGGDAATGTLTVNGSYTQADAGTLAVRLGGLSADSQFDQLRVTGTATLSGTLSVSLFGGFTPQEGNQFAVLTASSRSGGFMNTDFPDLGGGLFLTAVYDPADVTLRAQR
jgi:hypothetical protein